MIASELRLGNWINVKCIAKECGHDEFDPQECNIHNLQGILTGNDDFLYEPILLTEDWLVRFGFKNPYDPAWFYLEINPLSRRFIVYVNPDNRGIALFDNDDNEQYTYHIELKYVHQLQNLYFALTGKELMLNAA